MHVLVVLLFLSVPWGVPGSTGDKQKGGLSILLVEENKSGINGGMLTLDSAGRYVDIGGNIVNDVALKRALERQKLKNQCVVQVLVEEPEKVNVNLLWKAIGRLRTAADPNVQTQVFIHVPRAKR